jgi:hypothetical protein
MSSDDMARRRNHLLWLGPLVVFAGFVSYYQVFARFAVLRDFPWINLPVIWVGVVVTALGLRQAFRRGRGKILGSIALLFSVLVAGLFHAYVFWYSYQMPAAATAPTALAPAPDFTLVDQHGRSITLSDFRGRKVVLVFYRGHW